MRATIEKAAIFAMIFIFLVGLTTALPAANSIDKAVSSAAPIDIDRC